MPDALNRLDLMIREIENAVRKVETHRFSHSRQAPPCPASFVIVQSVGRRGARARQHAIPCEVLALEGDEVVFRGINDAARGSVIELTILAEKTAEGEVLYVCRVTVRNTEKTSGGYVFTGSVEEMTRKSVPAHRRFVEFVADNDAAGWNRWCADLADGPILRRLDLSNADLRDFDLCCADMSDCTLRGANLSNTNLSGADLSRCILDNVVVTGADLFRTRLPREYMNLILACGLIEQESVVLV